MEETKYLFTNKQLSKLLVPLVIEQLLAITVGLADSIMVSSVGESAVSAVSLVDSIMILLINIFAALATGGAVIAGQYIGKKKLDKACKAGEQLILFVSVFSVIIMILMYICKKFILTVVFGSIDQEVMNYCNTYLLIVSLSIPFIALYNAGAALFRVMGNSKISMNTSLLMNGINVVGNAICIYAIHMDVAGVAIPTLISRIVASIVIICLLKNPDLIVHFTNEFKFKFDKKMIKSILSIGVPNGVENSMFQLGKIILLSLIATFGTASITANAVSNAVACFEILPGLALGMGLITVISRCVGAKEYEQARYYTKKLMKIAYITMIILNIIMILLLPVIVKVYGLSYLTSKMTKELLILHGVCACIIWPVSFCLPNTLRAANDAKYTMVVGVLSMWIFRIVCGYILGKYLGFGVFGVWVAMIIDWIVRSVFFIIRYRGNSWIRA